MTKIKFHKCHSLREYNKIHRKYWRLYYKRNKRPWVWLSISFIGDDLDSKELLKLCDRDFVVEHIRYEIVHHYNEKVKMNGKVYQLVGLEMTNEDFYYLLQDLDNKIIAVTCCAPLNYIV